MGGNGMALFANPANETFTVSAKPFFPETVIIAAGLTVPTVMVIVEGLTDKLKSGFGGGLKEPPPLQPQIRIAIISRKQLGVMNIRENLNLLLLANIDGSSTHLLCCWS
jgi:hypothetical protein